MYTKKFYFDAKNHLPFSVLRCDQYPLRRKRKRAKNRRFKHDLARDATGIDRVAKRRTAGDISHRNTTFLYTSLSCVINIQILNCGGSFDGVSWRTAARTAGEPWSTLLALQGWHDKDSAAILNLIHAAEKRRYTRRAQRNRILAGESELLFRPELPHPQTYQLSRICAPSPTCKRISISQAATLFNIPTLPTQIRHFLYRIWGHDAVSLLWGAGEDFKHEVQVVPHNKVRFFTAGFHTPLNFTSGLLDCSVQNVPGCIYKRPPQVVWERLDDNGNDGL